MNGTQWMRTAGLALVCALALSHGPRPGLSASPGSPDGQPAAVVRAPEEGDAMERQPGADDPRGPFSLAPAPGAPEAGLALGAVASRGGPSLGDRAAADAASARGGAPAERLQTGQILLTSDLTPGCVRLVGLTPETMDCTLVAGQGFLQNMRAQATNVGGSPLVRIELTGAAENMTFLRVDDTGLEQAGPVEAAGSVSGRLRFTPTGLQLTAPGAPIEIRYRATVVGPNPGQQASAEAVMRLHVLPDSGGHLVGYSFNDQDGDGQRDAAEAGLASWPLRVTGAPTGAIDAVTDANGRFQLPGLPTGTYTVTQASRPGWQATRPDTVSLSIPAGATGSVFEISFGHRQTAAPSEISAKVQTDRGCTELGQSPTYLLQETMTVYLEALGLSQFELTLSQRDPSGALRPLFERQSVPGAQAFSFGTQAGAAMGPHSLVLDVYSPGAGSPAVTVTCGYAVQQPTLATVHFEPASVNFGAVAVGASASAMVSVSNLGQAPLTLNTLGIQGGGGSPFLLAGPSLEGQIIQPGGTVYVALSFAPRAEGSYQDFLQIRCSAPNQPLISVPLYGQTPANGGNGSAYVRTDRGCMETGQSPLYFVNDPISLQFRVDAPIERYARVRLDDLTPDGKQVTLYNKQVNTNQAYNLGGIRVVPPVGKEAIRLSAQVSYEIVRSECTFGVAAGGTRIVGYKFHDLNGNGIWEGCPLTPQVPGNEPAIPGWGINLTGPQSGSTLTDASGRFEFVVSAPGAYTIVEESRSGWHPTRQPAVYLNIQCYAGERPAPILYGNYCDIIASTPDPFATATPWAFPTPATVTATPTFGPSPTAQPTVIGGATPTNTPPIPPPPPVCAAVISPRPSLMNVADRAQFAVNVTGGGPVTGFQWTVDGDILRDYQETTRFAWSVTPMQAADFRRQTLDFYWKPLANQRHPLNAGPQPRRVAVTVTTTQGQCTTEHLLNVERNNYNITRQADDAYTTNHTNAIQTEHSFWHSSNPFTGWTYDGTLFFDFHRQFLDRFNNFRAEFGYPPIGLWDSGTSIPRGADIDHAPRGGFYVVQPKPSWFSLTGTIRRPSNGLPCDTTGGGQRRLAEYPSNRRLLGCAVTHTWHNAVHTAVGGDMLNIPFSPRDPLFWRWHNFIDVISQERQGALYNAAMAMLDPFADAEPAEAQQLPGKAPQVVYEEPFRIYRFIDGLDRFVVQFDQPVINVTADLLTVNDMPATQVVQDRGNRWIFSGFPAPGMGDVTIHMEGGQVKNLENILFTGRDWAYRRVSVEPGLDEDRDGLSNQHEVFVSLTSPLDRDTDDDGLSDGDEVITHKTSPHQLDTDADGAGDRCELERGSDPLDPSSTARGCPVDSIFFCWVGKAAQEDS